MKYVYLLQSLSVPEQRYIGITANLDERLRTHNAGGSPHTSKYRPRKVVRTSVFKMISARSSSSGISSLDLDMPLRRSDSGRSVIGHK